MTDVYETVNWMTETLWRNGLAVVPLAVVIWAVIRWGVDRPATRHALWLGALAWLAVGILVPPAETRIIEVDFDSAPTDREAQAVAVNDDSHVKTDYDGDPVSRAEKTEFDVESNRESVAESHAKYFSEDFEFVRDDSDDSSFDPIDDRFESNSTNRELAFALDVESVDEEINGASPQSVATGDAPFTQDPTPPTMVARTATRAPSFLNEAHGPVGRPSPFLPGGDEFETFSDPSSESPAVDVALADFGQTQESGERIVAVTLDSPSSSAPSESGWSIAPWALYWLQLRNQIASIPPIPASIWFGVVALIVIFRIGGCLRLQRRLSHARPASHRVQSLVNACAASIGVRRAPRALFVNDRVSPMLLCIPRPQLIIPKALWADLDRAGRRAVILHELAHLKRRDHWTHWFELLIGAVYWWHPVIWWMRQRLRDEAENACDAWVTWFEPKQRRAYANALIQAQQFVGDSGRSSPVPAVGVVSPRANRIARRLTMVMTHRATPKASSFSVFALPVLFLMAWSVVPATTSACPSEGEVIDVAPVEQKFIRGRITSDADSFVVLVGDDGFKVLPRPAPENVAGKYEYSDCTIYVSPESKCTTPVVEKGCVRVQPDTQEIVVYPVQAPRGVEVVSGPARAAPYNKTSVSIHGRKVHLDAGPQYATLAIAEAPTAIGGGQVQYATAPEIVVVPCESEAAAGGTARVGGTVYAVASGNHQDGSGGRRGGRVSAARRMGGPRAYASNHDHDHDHAHSHSGDDRIARLEAQMERLSKQMAELSASIRSGGPGTRGGAGRAVPFAKRKPAPPRPSLWSGTAASPVVVRKYSLPEGKLKALTKLMVRADVPTRVRPLDDGIEVHASEADQRKFALFVDMITGEGMDHTETYHLAEDKMADLTRLMERDDVPVLIYRGKGQMRVKGNGLTQRIFRDFLTLLASPDDAVSVVVPARPTVEYDEASGAYAEVAAAMNRRARQQVEIANKNAMISELKAKLRALQREAEAIEEQADRLSDKAEESEDKVEVIEDRIEHADSEAEQAEFREVLQQLRHLSKDLHAQAEMHYREAREIEDRADAIEDRIDRLEDEIAVAKADR